MCKVRSGKVRERRRKWKSAQVEDRGQNEGERGQFVNFNGGGEGNAGKRNGKVNEGEAGKR